MASAQYTLFYHDLAFRYLIDKHYAAIGEALHDRPLDFRKKEFLPTLPFNAAIFGDEAWTTVHNYLLKIEDELQRVIRDRHLLVWLHVYRRIGVSLSPLHEGKTDAATVALVRRTAELAYAKYAGKDPQYEITLSGSLKPGEILGGQFIASAVALGVTFESALDLARGVINSNQWVLTDFTPELLVDVFWVEGLSYEHWRTAAMLRAIGKGAGIVYEGTDWPSFIENDELRELIVWYDRRIEDRGFFSTLAGTVVTDRTLKRIDPTRHALTPFYNVERVTAKKAFGDVGSTFGDEFIPNFLMAITPLYEFKESVEYLSAEFERLYGFSLDDLCLAIATIAIVSLVPPGALDGRVKSEAQEFLRQSFLQLTQRAYKLTNLRASDLIEYAVILGNREQKKFQKFSKAGIERAFESLRLTPDKEKFVGLWSGGKWFPLIDVKQGKVINLVGIQDLLHRLFVGVRDKLGHRGGAFEEAFRAVLTGHNERLVHFGELRFHDGSKREVDAAVRKGRTLVLFECRAMERPLDYDIGRPKTMQARKADFETKVDQVLTLKKKIESSNVGRNFDFSWSEEILAYVVSPFVEFIYEHSERMVDGEWPRILSVDEAVARLEAI